jgi:ribonuclease VapC
MIVVDSSAVIEVLLKQPQAARCEALLESGQLAMSAGTVAELLIVALRKDSIESAEELLQGLNLDIHPVTPAAARRVAHAYARWGKGVHAAGLNFGDCFAYALARELDVPLLYVGTDFALTDIRSAL